MGSVYVTWKGTCADRAVQTELLGYIRRLAKQNERLLSGPAPKRPKFLDVLHGQREEKPALDLIRNFDQAITGNIVLDPYMVLDGQRLKDDVDRTKTELISVEAAGTEKPDQNCLSLDLSGAQVCLRLPRLQLHGLDFKLFDPRDLYPNADRVSFVFLNSPDLPALDGCLAQIENKAQCQAYNSPLIQAADWYISSPSIHLRYYVEEVFDYLLSWVKYFFISDLHYNRYEDMSGYDSIRPLYEESCAAQDKNVAAEACFHTLLGFFSDEANKWTDKIGAME